MMYYGSLQAEWCAKHNGHIHRLGTIIFVNIVVYVSKPIKNNNYFVCGKI